LVLAGCHHAAMTDTEAVRRPFDNLAAEYDQYIPFFGTFGRDLVAWCGRPRRGPTRGSPRH
jgi:hypothetical protein